MPLKFRLATEADTWTLMALYQRLGSTHTKDELFLDYFKLLASINSSEHRWVIGERVGEGSSGISTTISLLVDSEQRLAKISRIIVNPGLPSVREDLRDSLRFCKDFLSRQEPAMDVLYCTTMTVPTQFHEVTLEEGFKILGIFPNAMGADASRLNGLTAYYFSDTIETKRFKDFALHPSLLPFYEISRNELGLAALPPAPPPTLPSEGHFGPIGTLEVIDAPEFVRRKFDGLRKKRKQVTAFYPFYRPNLMITSPGEEIQIFVKIIEANRFAAIVGEELLISVDPAKLYQNVIQLLRMKNVSYIEIINDAADTLGNKWIMEASFSPCCYIPAFKRQGDIRRDYVVFCKSFEYVCRPDLNVKKPFLDFFSEFFKLEWRTYVGNK